MTTRATPNPETVSTLLDTTWRLAAAEAARTDAIDRKASTVATFASLVAALTATLGITFVTELQAWWALALFIGGLGALVASVVCAVWALWPREYLTLGIAYIRRFPTWHEVLKHPSQVQGETMRTLVEAIARERLTSDGKLAWLRRSFVLLLIGLLFIAVEGGTLAFEEVRR
jgi:heme A synthase